MSKICPYSNMLTCEKHSTVNCEDCLVYIVMKQENLNEWVKGNTR